MAQPATPTAADTAAGPRIAPVPRNGAPGFGLLHDGRHRLGAPCR